ncbi:unnamed protein product, partial [Nesidiocoris tenuis]
MRQVSAVHVSSIGSSVASGYVLPWTDSKEATPGTATMATASAKWNGSLTTRPDHRGVWKF